MIEIIKKNPIINLSTTYWKYAKEKRLKVVIFLMLSLTSNLLFLTIPLIMGKVFDLVQFSDDDSNILGQAMKLLALIIGIEVAAQIFHHSSRIIEHSIAFFVREKYMLKLFGIVLNLPPKWHENHHSGDTIDKVNRASWFLFDFGSEIFMLLENFIKLVGSILILIYFDFSSSLGVFLISLTIVLIIIKFDKRLEKGYKKVYRKENYLASGVFDYISNIFTIFTLRIKKNTLDVIETRIKRIYPQYMKNIWVNEIKWYIVGFLISLMSVGMIAFNAYNSYILTGMIEISVLFILYRYLEKVGSSFFNFAWFYGELLRKDSGVNEAKRFFDDYEWYQKQDEVLNKASLPENWRKVEIKKLVFSYSNNEKKNFKGVKKRGHLKNLNIEIVRGEKIALVGESGSGKSTLLVLIRGLYQPLEGFIYIDGKKNDEGLRSLNTHATLVPQEPEIFDSTVENNITFGLKKQGRDIDRAIRMASFEPVLKKLPKGMKTNVMEKGVSLSGGEKQRLALARGLFMFMREWRKKDKQNHFILLDEPTSSIDSKNEYLIYKNILEFFKNSTILSSIHRLHLLEFFDRIYYFKKGEVAASGTLEEVFKNKDFKKAWNAYKRKI